jgi:ribosomal protein S6
MKFETIIIYKPDTPDEVINQIEDRINDNIKIYTIEDLGIKKLAYKIQEYTEGRYSVIRWTGQPEQQYEIDKILKEYKEAMKFINMKAEEE